MQKQRRTLISILILVFFAVCFLQVYPSPREDWPFSFFGMYIDRKEPINIVRVEIDLITQDGQRQSLYDLGSSFDKYFAGDLLKILTGSRNMTQNSNPLKTDPETLEKTERFVRRGIVPILQKRNLFAPQTVLQIRYRFWSHLTPENFRSAELDQKVLEGPLSQWSSP